MREVISRAVLISVAAFWLVATNGAAKSENMSMAQAFCNDLKAGYTPFQILMPMIRKSQLGLTAKTAPYRAHLWAQKECPEQLETNQVFRSYLEDWNIKP